MRFSGGIPHGFDNALSVVLGNALEVSPLFGTASPFGDLCRQYTDQPSQVHSLSDLCNDPGFSGRLVRLDDPDESNWSAWRDFLGRYAHVCRSQDLIKRTLFLVSLAGHPPDKPPAADVALTNQTWDGALDDVDLLLFASEHLRDRSDNILLRSLLATSVARVASWDFDTAAMLVEESNEVILNPTELLRGIAIDKGWTAETPFDWGLGTASGAGIAHAARAAIDCPPIEINQRLWSAQLSVLLPWIETCRHEMVAANVYEVKRLLRGSGGKDADPYELELKDLSWLFSRRGADGEIRRTFKQLQIARNHLAHRRNLSPDAVIDLLSAMPATA